MRPVRVATAAVLAVLAGCAGGCSLDAVFDLTLELPADDDGTPTHAVIEAAPSDAPFGEADFTGADWRTARRDGFLLVPADSREAQLSVLADTTSEHDRPLRLRVRLCDDPRCDAAADDTALEAHIELERVFYAGEVTSATIDTRAATFAPPGDRPDAGPLPDAGPTAPCDVEAAPDPSGVIRVGRCEIRGCLAGSTHCFCRRNGTHYCE